MATSTLPTIRPISDLRTNLPEIEAEAHSSGEPIVLTRNGKSSLVLMDSEAYDESIRRERAIRKLREAEIESRYRPNPISESDVRNRIADILESVRIIDANR